MITYESAQARLDRRYNQATKNIHDMAANADGSVEDSREFVRAMQEMAYAGFAVREQHRLKHSLTKAVIDAIQ